MKVSRTEYALKNFASNTLSTAVNALLSFISRTVFVYILGETYLGVSGLFTNLLGVLSLAELGIASAISFSLYKPLAEADTKKVSAIINFYRDMYRIVAVVVTVFGLCVIPFLDSIVKGAEEILNLRLIYLLYLFNTITSYLITYKATILSADQKNYFVVNINTAIKVITMAIQIILLVVYRNFILYLSAEIVIQFVGKLYINRFVDRKYPYLQDTCERLDEEEKRVIFSKIKALAVHKFGDVSINQTDNIITSMFINVTMVGLVSNFVMVISVVRTFINAFFNSATAGFGNLIATETEEKNYAVSKVYDYLGFLFYGWSAVVLYFCLTPFVTIWMGEERLIDNATVALLCANYYFTGARTPLANVKIAAGIFEQDQWVPFVQAMTNIIVSIIGAKYWGLKGIYIGTLISSMWPNIVRPIIIYKYVFHRSSIAYFKRYLCRIVYLFVVSFCIGVVLKLIWTANDFINLLLAFGVSSVICGTGLLIVSRNKEEALYVYSLVQRVLRKLKKEGRQMHSEPLVSIITPCYNGEKYLSPYFDGLLNQDYQNFELIFVDDGSTDSTQKIAMEYGEKLIARGAKFRYIYQENAGQAAAINKGLEIFSGDYLMWLDSDDILYPNHLSEKVNYLEDNFECGFLLSQGELVDSNALNVRKKIMKREKPKGEDNFFEDLINENNVVFGPGTVMVRRTVVISAIPELKIFESRQGQNWQLMLPIAYLSKPDYLEKVLFKCVEHFDSHSRKHRTYDEWNERLDEFQELLTATVYNIPTMPDEEKAKWGRCIQVKTVRKKLLRSYRYLRVTDIKRLRKELIKKNGQIEKEDGFIWFVFTKLKERVARLF